MVTYQNRKIIYSLEYGGYEKRKILIVLGSLFAALILCGIAVCITVCVTTEDPCNGTALWLWVAFTICFGAVPLILVLSRRQVEKRHDKQIEKWLQSDQIILKTVKPWFYRENNMSRVPDGNLVHRFGVSFYCDGQKHDKTSKHFDHFYKTVRGKKIDILYIPEYDQVLVLEH